MGGRASRADAGPQGSGTRECAWPLSELYSPIPARGVPLLFTVGWGKSYVGGYTAELTTLRGLGWLSQCPVTGGPPLSSVPSPVQWGL